MIYLFKKPLMIVGYFALILINSAAYSAAEDIAANPIAAVVVSQAAVDEQGDKKDNSDLQPESSVTSPSSAASIVAAKTAIISSVSIPDDVMTFKSVKGLNIPAQSQSKIIPTNQASDVRVIIDISGSMKENDGDNVRIPALNLIVEMLPEGSQAGVWTFGQWVNMLIPPEKVDDAWRKNAKLQAQKINSHGLRTNIGEAMEKAIWRFEKDSQYDQHVILLTDGLVDIAADNDANKQKKNQTERQRILTQVLKQYQDLGVKIHTIALSDKADKSLLEKLALETNGTSEIVNNADELVKAFLKAFEQAAPVVAEQVPLSKDNTFEIDASIDEFTALIFTKDGSTPTQLISPSGQVISQIKSSESAKWFGESLYDLVTLTNPEPGQWKIEADLDPDNRVTVVSDLKMEIANLPTTLFPGQQVDFEVYLHENGEIINNPDLLKLMTIEMTMTAESGRSGTKQINNPDNIPEDGRFQESIKRLEKEGQYELTVNVDGKTFQRMRKEYIQVSQPIGFEIRKQLINQKQVYAVRVIPQVPDIQVSKTRVIAKLKGPDANSIIQAVPWVEEGLWEVIIDANKGPGEYKVSMNIKGRLAEDKDFRIKPDPIVLTFPIPDDFAHEFYVEEVLEQSTETPAEVLAETDTKPITEPETSIPDLAAKLEEQEDEPVQQPAEDATENIDDIANVTDDNEQDDSIPSWVFILIPIATILLGVGGFFVYRVMSKKKAAAKQSAPAVNEDKGMSGSEVSLGDGMDDDDFDEDFDLSDSDDLDDLDGLDLSNDEDDLDDLGEMPGLDDDISELEDATDEPKDDIPDFDENFDVDADASEVDKPPEQSEVVDTPEETASALDELDSVLDGLSEEDEENIPQLEDDQEANAGGAALGAEPDEKEVPQPESMGELADDEDLEGEAAVDAALANLESELEDLGLDDAK
ncbi:MAG: hypothetical protein ACI843_000037 [Psychrobacter glaciei]|jgi:uncharacterized protein (TIGR03503 family)